jgi:uncharacterized protein YkwD
MFDSAVRRLALLLILSATLLAPSALTPARAEAAVSAPGPAPAAAPGLVPAPIHQPGAAATLMAWVVIMTNEQRSAVGCGPLDVDLDLILASVRQSKFMALTHNMSHIGWGGSTFVGRAHAAGYAQPSGENIGWGYETATGVMNAWMASPPHRANILNCAVQSIGTGVAYAADGSTYYTQVFGWS